MTGWPRSEPLHPPHHPAPPPPTTTSPRDNFLPSRQIKTQGARGLRFGLHRRCAVSPLPLLCLACTEERNCVFLLDTVRTLLLSYYEGEISKFAWYYHLLGRFTLPALGIVICVCYCAKTHWCFSGSPEGRGQANIGGISWGRGRMTELPELFFSELGPSLDPRISSKSPDSHFLAHKRLCRTAR